MQPLLLLSTLEDPIHSLTDTQSEHDYELTYGGTCHLWYR